MTTAKRLHRHGELTTRAPSWGLCATVLFALSSLVACAGRTSSSGGGPLASCGDNCTTDQVASSCSSTCAKIAQAGCLADGSDCTSSCAQFPTDRAECASQAYAFLRCIEPLAPTCAAGGYPEFAGCDAAQQAAEDCVNRSSSSPPSIGGGGPSTNPGRPDDPSVCPGIPRPQSGGMFCAGGGSASGSGGAGPGGAPPSCQSSCQDNANNTWSADCQGTTCTCTYNGGSACTCQMMTSGCASCCPGT